MARLGARGRQEVFRVERERDTPDDKAIVWRKETYVLASDGSILRKSTVKFAPNPNLGETKPKLHDWGWKNTGKNRLKEPHQLLEAFARKGFVVVSASGINNFDAAYYRALAAAAPANIS